MFAKDVLSLLETISPLEKSRELCEKYGMFDNSGMIVKGEGEIKSIMFSLDLSFKSLQAAKEKGCNCIATHHPAIFGGIKNLADDAPMTKCLMDCVKNDITVISMHLNFDVAPFGTDYNLMHALGGQSEIALLDSVEGGGYGRVYDISPKSFGEIIETTKIKLCTQRVLSYGPSDKKISRAASFCGAGGDEKAAAFALLHGAELFVSCEMRHHVICDLVQRGICVLLLTHYSSESYGLKNIMTKLEKSCPVPVYFYADEDML